MKEEEEQDFDQPTTDDLLQEEEEPAPMTPIPVVVEGPVRTQNPAARTANAFHIDLPNGGDAEIIIGEDMRRAAMRFYSTSGTAAFFISTDRRRVQDGSAARFNSGVLVPFHTTSPVYAKSASAADCELSVLVESWTD